MSPNVHTRLLAAGALIALSACAGGGGAPGTMPHAVAAPGSMSSSTPGETSATLKLGIPVSAKTARGNAKPAFVSPSTNGISLAVYTSPRTSNPTPISTYTYDVSSSSSACTASGGTRTCTIALPVAPGTYDFVATLYDAAPVNNSFASAKALGTGTATATPIVQNMANVVSIGIGGLISTITLGPARTVDVNTSALSYALAVSAFDADGNAITGGPTDAYANPITLTASDTGGNHTTLSLNGGAPASSVTTSQSSDVVTVAYDGGGAAGYFATIAANASGATQATAGLDSFNASLTLVSFLGTTAPQTVTIDEPHNTGPASITVPPNCTNITSASAVTAGVPDETFVLSAGTLAGQCYVTATSETDTAAVQIKVVNQVPGVVTIPVGRIFATIGGNSIEAFSLKDGSLVQTISGAATTIGSLNGIARDSAGNIYVSDIGTGQIDEFASNASGNVAPASTLTPPQSNGSPALVAGVGLDRAGDIFVGNLFGGFNTAELQAFAPGTSSSATPVSTATSTNFSCAGFAIVDAIAVDPSGRTYVAYSCGSSGYVDEIAFGATAPFRTITLSYAPAEGGIALDLSGDVYVVDSAAGGFFEYASNAFGAATPIRTGTGLTSPQGIAVSTTGTVYVLTHPGSGSSAVTSVAVYANGASSPQSTVQIAPTSTSAEFAL